MPVKINEKIISIPPYISTNWSRIASLHMKENVLAITLHDGYSISIPGLPTELIESIFNYHAAHLEKLNTESAIVQQVMQDKDDFLGNLIESGPSLRFGFGSLDGFGNSMQHNPAQSQAPDLPPEVLQKISSISKVLASEDMVLPKAESGCNCFHCQIARTLNPNADSFTENQEEICDQDLYFQQWDISQSGDKLFSVSNRLDGSEKYNVYLGEPIGCTCGKQGCEHIIAVLKS